MKYYIASEINSEVGKSIWYMIEDDEGVYVKYYCSEKEEFRDVTKNRGSVHVTGEYKLEALKTAKRVSKKKWEEEAFISGL